MDSTIDALNVSSVHFRRFVMILKSTGYATRCTNTANFAARPQPVGARVD